METHITFGYIIDKSQYKKLLMAPELPLLYNNVENFLIIYALNSKLSRITCYPLEKPGLLKISIAISNLDRKIAEDLSRVFDDFKLVHTTGVCEMKGGFGLEYYLKSTNVDADKIKIMELLDSQNLAKVSKVEKVPPLSI